MAREAGSREEVGLRGAWGQFLNPVNSWGVSRCSDLTGRKTVLPQSAKCNFLKFAVISCEISRNNLADLFHEISRNFTKLQEITANFTFLGDFGREDLSGGPGVRPSSGAASYEGRMAGDKWDAFSPSGVAAPEDGRTPEPLRLILLCNAIP